MGVRLLLMFQVLVVWCLADTIRLKNGNVFHGRIIREAAKEVVIEVPYGKVTLRKKDIADISRDTAVDNIIYQGDRLLTLGAIEHGIEYFEKALQQHPNEPLLVQAIVNAYSYAGQYYLEKGYLAQAQRYFRLASRRDVTLDLSKEMQKIRRMQKQLRNKKQLADYYLQKRKFEQALKIYLQLVENAPSWQQEIAPNLALAAANLGNRHYHGKRYPQAVHHYRLALEHRPQIYPKIEKSWLYANLQHIVDVHIAKQQWVKAEDSLDRLLRVSPSCRPALYLQGVLRERRRDLAGAFDLYKQVTNQDGQWSGDLQQLHRMRAKARKQSGITFLEGNDLPIAKDTQPQGVWREYATEHFRIFHYHDKLAERVANTVEFHWKKIIQRLAPKPWNATWPQHCKIFIHPSKKQFRTTTNMPGWARGVTNALFRDGRLIKHEIHVYQSAPLLISSILPHELTHAMYPWITRYQIHLPLWLNEGIAITSEPAFHKRNRLRIFRLAVNTGNTIPLKRLFTMRQYPPGEKTVEVFYAQSFAIVDYLLRIGNAKHLLKFCLSLQRKPAASALLATYEFATLKDFRQQWNAAVNRYSLTNSHSD